MLYICPICRIEFKAKPSRQRRSKEVFCSTECYHKSMVNTKRPAEICKRISENHSRHFLGKAHTEEAKEKNRIAHSGTNSKCWKGGKRTAADGYICIYKPDHPFANSASLVAEHRLIAETIIRRFLKPEEVVHRIDKNIKNNSPDNLYIFGSASAHTKFHSLLRKYPHITLISNLSSYC